MPSNPERLQYLFQQYLSDTGTPDEIREFWKLFAELEENDPVKRELWQLWHAIDHEEPFTQRDWDDVLRQIHQRAAAWESSQLQTGRWKAFAVRAAAAAAVIFLLGSGLYFLFFNKPPRKLAETGTHQLINDISPGGNKAVLTLANGSTIILNNIHNGKLAIQGNSKVVKIDSDLLVYNQQASEHDRQLAIQYNTVRTPRGGQFQLILSDGTKVWLNAASSIRFPTSFSGSERKVDITGEAYFEVARNEGIPFIVKNGDVEVKVLGTQFNVNTYEDEDAIKVTLLEGSVKILELDTHHSQLITPGQQVQVDKNGNMKLVENVNVKEVIAWKNNLFWFEDDDIQTVMRQVARWYDAKVVIDGNIPQHFTGSIPRDIMVSGVFEVLQRTGSIHYKIKDGKIIVSP